MEDVPCADSAPWPLKPPEEELLLHPTSVPGRSPHAEQEQSPRCRLPRGSPGEQPVTPVPAVTSALPQKVVHPNSEQSGLSLRAGARKDLHLHITSYALVRFLS